MDHSTASAANEIPFVYRRRLFWGDTDTARIAYTSRFLDFMLEAGEAWMRTYLGTDWFIDTSEHERGSPIVHLEMDFMSPLTPKDALEVEVRIERAGETSITYHCTGYGNDRRLSFRGRFTSAGLHYASGERLSLPHRTREIIEDYQAKCAAAKVEL